MIGIDEGAYLALKAGVKLDVAIGDFDSIDQDNWNILRKILKL